MAIGKVALLAPPEIVTVAGTDALVLDEPSLMDRPVEGAIPSIVTVPVLEVPPTTAFGATLKLSRVAGRIVSAAVF